MIKDSELLLGRYVADLRWRPLVAHGEIPVVALARARESRAPMYVHDGVTAVVGLAGLVNAGKRKPVYSIAAMAAKAFATGEAIVAVRASPGRWWVGGVTDGVPFADTLVDSQPDAFVLVEQMRLGRPAATVHGDPELHVPESEPLSIEQLQPFESPETRLRDARRRLPQWSYVVMAAAVALLVYQQGVPQVKRYMARRSAVATPAVDPVAAWKAANAAWMAGIKKPVGQDLSALREALYELPLNIGGWEFLRATCSFSAGWNCAATYQRPTEVAAKVTNRSFEDSRPKAWSVAWKGASELTASFQAPQSRATTLADQYLPGLQVYQIDTYSEFQELSKAFQKVEIMDMKRVDVHAPRDSRGGGIERPRVDLVPELFRAGVSFSGPLRNIEVLEQMKAPVFWNEATVNRAKVEKPTLLNSELVGAMKGEIYAKTK